MARLLGAANPAWRGGRLEYRGEDWPAQRRAARARDGDTCQRCGHHSRNLPVHHIWPFRLWADYRDANVLENLITLCPPCHGTVESEFQKSHPEALGGPTFPNVHTTYICTRCGQSYKPTGARARICTACHTLTCVACAKTFFSDRAATRPIRFCSRACNYAYKRLTGQRYQPRICIGCGATFTDTKKPTRYCSQACHVSHDPPHQYRQQAVAKRMRADRALDRTEAASSAD